MHETIVTSSFLYHGFAYVTAELHIPNILARDCVRRYPKSDPAGRRLRVRALAQE